MSCELISEVSLPTIDQSLPFLHLDLLLLVEDAVHVLLPRVYLLQLLLHLLQFTLETLPLGLLKDADALQLLLPLFVWRTHRRRVFLLGCLLHNGDRFDACLFFFVLIGMWVWASMFGGDEVDVLWDSIEYLLSRSLLLLHDDALRVESGLAYKGVSVGLRSFLPTFDVDSFAVGDHLVTGVPIEPDATLFTVYIGFGVGQTDLTLVVHMDRWRLLGGITSFADLRRTFLGVYFG